MMGWRIVSDMSSERDGIPVRRVGRPEKPVDPSSGPRARLAQELRDLRTNCAVPTLKILADYVGVDQRRLGEAARDGSRPSWHAVESYVQGCWAYYENEQGRPFPGGDLDYWKQLHV